jgi:hypothetical protein
LASLKAGVILGPFAGAAQEIGAWRDQFFANMGQFGRKTFANYGVLGSISAK